MDHVQLVRETWKAWSSGDLETIEAVLCPDARWRAVEDGPWNCDNRAQILEVIRRNRERRGGPAGKIEDIMDLGQRLVVAFRPDDPDPDGWPLGGGVRYTVLTLAGDRVIEMKGCRDRESALAYASQA